MVLRSVVGSETFLAKVWTPDEWDLAPDTSGLELIDGVVHAMAAATPRHEYVKTELRNVLKRLVTAELAVTTEIEVRLADSHRRKPDVLVVFSERYDLDRPLLQPEQVLLVVEVVSPGSETIDRRHKHLEYGDAGIAHYWRIETRPAVEVHTFRLGEAGAYLETGLFRAGDRVDDPTLTWAAFDVDELVP
jgi:Uma2 family endonuclease